MIKTEVIVTGPSESDTLTWTHLNSLSVKLGQYCKNFGISFNNQVKLNNFSVQFFSLIKVA